MANHVDCDRNGGDVLSHTTENMNGACDQKEKKTVQFGREISHLSNWSQVTHDLTFTERFCSWRYALIFLTHFAFFTGVMMRNCLPIALVCMTDPSPHDPANSSHNRGVSSGNTSSTYDALTTNTSQSEYEFHWDTQTQGLILSAVQFSSCVGPLLCDAVRLWVGSKHTMTLCSLSAVLLTFLTPVGSRVSPWVLFAIRILLGLVLGANVCISADVTSWWAPAPEKQTMMSLALAGVNLGSILTSLVSGFLCTIPVDNGWPFIFYVSGTIALVWTVFWHLLVANKPESHRFISEAEATYIVSHRTPVEDEPTGKKESPPYKTILTSVPVVSFLAASASQVWTSNLYYTYLPKFFVTVNGFSVEETGILMSLVSVARFLGIPMWTVMINKLRTMKLSHTKAKKLTLATGYGLCILSQMVIVLLDMEFPWVCVALFMVILAGQSAGMTVFRVLPLDMAPRYAAFLSGLFTSLGSLVSISGPLMVAAITKTGTRDEWRVVWIVVICVFLTSVIIFVTFGDASVQPWARVHRDSRPNIQSPFVSMGRRLSAVIDGPLTPTSSVQGGVAGPTHSYGLEVSMSPYGPHDNQSQQYVEREKTLAMKPTGNGHSPRLYPSSKERRDSPSVGVVNAGFQSDQLSPGKARSADSSEFIHRLRGQRSDGIDDVASSNAEPESTTVAAVETTRL